MKEVVYKCDSCKNRLNGKAIAGTAFELTTKTVLIRSIEDNEYNGADKLFCNFICLARFYEKDFGMPYKEEKSE